MSSAVDAQIRRTVLILLEEPHAWLAAATLARKAPQGSIETLISPVPGVGFLAATGQEAVDLDAWWSRMATTPGRAVVIAAHEDDLLRWIPGADADFVVAVPDEATLAAYQHLPNVQATVSDDPRQLAEVALGHVGLAPAREPVSEPAAQIAPTPAPEDSRPTEPEPQVERRTAIDPFELISRAQALEVGPESNGGLGPEAFGAHTTAVSPPPSPGQAKPRVPAAVSEPQTGAVASPSHPVSHPTKPDGLMGTPGSRGGLDPRQILDRLGQGRRAQVSAELGQAVLACKPIVAAVVSRKGGVGKTASAAAVAAILGEAVDPFGHTAALVDANIGNPDAWGRLDVNGEPTTMREIVGRLMSGREPPGPAFAQTPALAVYPESREAGDGYAPAQIQRVAAYLKTRHAAVIVDLPNRLPAFTSAEAAVAAAWIGEADVLVLPTTADPTALLGAIEYLDADSVQGKPVVVSYIVPRARQIRDAPQVRGMLDRIRASVSALVEVPDDDRATLALIQRVAITEVANELRHAYISLATRVVEAAASRNGRPT